MAITEGTYQGDVVRWEAERNFTRESVTVVAAAALKKGTVLGIKTADGKYYPSVSGAADGTQTAVAVLMDDLAITAGAPAVVCRRCAIVNYGSLIFDTSYSDQPKKDAAVASLKSASFIVCATLV